MKSLAENLYREEDQNWALNPWSPETFIVSAIGKPAKEPGRNCPKGRRKPGLCGGRKTVGSTLNTVEGKKVPIESGNQEGKSSFSGLLGKAKEGQGRWRRDSGVGGRPVPLSSPSGLLQKREGWFTHQWREGNFKLLLQLLFLLGDGEMTQFFF